MMSNLSQRAVLAVWPPAQGGGTTPGREFPTLRDAIQAAAGALVGAQAHPWIVVEDGTVLRPGWIRQQARALGFIE